jgi:hypothetical protein
VCDDGRPSMLFNGLPHLPRDAPQRIAQRTLQRREHGFVVACVDIDQ